MANSTPNQKSSPAEPLRTNRTGLAEISKKTETRDELYLFACHVEWCTKQSLVEYNECLRQWTIMTATFVSLQKNWLPGAHPGLRTDTDIEAW